ncbi:MAG: hypothetical protein QOJ09_2172 [Actinomycetota bacterium]|nr:hypothetical protein [Actinomycetota bacterium]
MRRSGLVLLASGLGSAVIGVFPSVHASAADDPGSGFGSYALSASAPGAQLTVGEPTYCYTSPAGLQGCDGVVPIATSTLSNGPTGSATAAVAWPGALAADLGSLIITASNGAAPDQARMLNDPVRAQVRTGQTPDTVTYDSVPGATMKAVAKATITSADAHVDKLTAAGLGVFGPQTSSTTTKLSGPKTGFATATASASDITIAGVVHIGSVTSTATATTDGTTATAKGTTEVTDVTVAGVPVTVDEKGVSVRGSGVALSTLTNTVNSALSQAGLTLLVSQPQGKPIGSAVTYNAGSLVAVFKPDPTHLFSVVMGGANVSVKAGKAFSFGSTGGTGGFTGTTGTLPSGTTGTGGLSGSPSTTGGSTASATTGGTDVPPPQTLTPATSAASTKPLYGGLSPWLGGFGLLGATLMAFGFKRLPDRVLEAVPSVCPLEENR